MATIPDVSSWPELDALKTVFNGKVVLPSDEEPYALAIQTWHLNPLLRAKRKPKVVLQPRGVRSGPQTSASQGGVDADLRAERSQGLATSLLLSSLPTAQG